MAVQNAQGMRAAAAPKLVAMQKLALASSAEPMQACALYSSLSALLGTAGQANYAAANAQLNTWAELQQCSGIRCLILTTLHLQADRQIELIE